MEHFCPDQSGEQNCKGGPHKNCEWYFTKFQYISSISPKNSSFLVHLPFQYIPVHSSTAGHPVLSTMTCCIILFVFVFVDSWVEDCVFLSFVMLVVVLLFGAFLCFLFYVFHCSFLTSLFWMSTLVGCLVFPVLNLGMLNKIACSKYSVADFVFNSSSDVCMACFVMTSYVLFLLALCVLLFAFVLR